MRISMAEMGTEYSRYKYLICYIHAHPSNRRFRVLDFLNKHRIDYDERYVWG